MNKNKSKEWYNIVKDSGNLIAVEKDKEYFFRFKF